VPKLQLTSGKPDQQEPDQRGEEQQALLADISGPYDERLAGLQFWKACCTWFAGVYVSGWRETWGAQSRGRKGIVHDGSHAPGALRRASAGSRMRAVPGNILLYIVLRLAALAPGKRLPRLEQAVAFKCGSEQQQHPAIRALAAQSGLLSVDTEGHVRLDTTRDKLLSAMASRVDAAARGQYAPGDRDMYLHPPACNPAAAKASVCMLLLDSVPRDAKEHAAYKTCKSQQNLKSRSDVKSVSAEWGILR